MSLHLVRNRSLILSLLFLVVVLVSSSADGQQLGSRHNPYPPGARAQVRLGNGAILELELEEIIRGDAAWEIVQASNAFNTPPGPGQQYVLAQFRIKVVASTEEPISINHHQFDAVSQDAVVYADFVSVAGLRPQLSVELYSGAEYVGLTYFLTEQGDNPLFVFRRSDVGGTWFGVWENPIHSLPSVSFRGLPDHWNGYHWQQMTIQEKVLFFGGYVAAINQFINVLNVEEDLISIPNDIEDLIREVDLWYDSNDRNERILDVIERL